MRLERIRRPARGHTPGHSDSSALATGGAARTGTGGTPPAFPGVRLGTLAGVTAAGAPCVTSPGWLEAAAEAILAAQPPTATLAAAIGCGVVLLSVAGEPARPVIVGWVLEPAAPGAVAPAAAPGSPPALASSEPPERVLKVDGERIVISAEQELELRCGKASVTLTADGRVLIRGRGILTHARELNRIRGGQVRIN